MSQKPFDDDYASVKPYEQGRRRSKRSAMWSAACEQDIDGAQRAVQSKWHITQ
jgi:hypothetical protein